MVSFRSEPKPGNFPIFEHAQVGNTLLVELPDSVPADAIAFAGEGLLDPDVNPGKAN